MSKTLLAIISCPRDNELVRRHWPYFKMTGWPILGSGSDDGKTEWPEPPLIRLDTGRQGKKVTRGISAIWGLCMQEMDCLEAFLKTDFDALMIVESDNLFVRKPPEHPGYMLYLVNLVPNMHKGIFSTSTYFSTPRYCDRETAKHLLSFGKRMIASGDHQFWISDRFMAHIAYTAKLRFQHYPSFTRFPFAWSAMSTSESFIKDSRTAITLGACCIHGVKTEQELKQITEGLVECPS